MLHLAGTGQFPADYVERVKKLEPSWALAGVRYVLDTQVFEAALTPVFSDESWLDDERFARMERGDWPEVPLIAIDSPSVFDPALVPAGHQVAVTRVFTSPDPTSEMAHEAIRRSELVLDELWPGWHEHVIRREPYGARNISLMTRDSVLPGLYLVGADAGGRGAGTHVAVDSGFHVAAMVDADLG